MRLIMTGALFIIVSLSQPLQEDHIKRGDVFYQSYNLAAALKEYQLAYDEGPTEYEPLQRLVRLYNDLGRIHLHTGPDAEDQYRRALPYADSLLRRYPDSAAAHFWYALAKGSLIPFVGTREKIAIGKEVREQIHEILKEDSTFSNAYVIKGVFEREASGLSWLEKGIVAIIFGENLSGSLERSEEYLRKALEFDPTNTYAYYELYWTYTAMGDEYRARSALRHVLDITPRNLRELVQQDEARQQFLLLSNKLTSRKNN